MKDNPRDWPRLLSETLWEYKTSKKSAIGVSPFALTYGHEAVLPIEIMVPYLRVDMKNHLVPEDYNEAMVMELEELDDERMQVLDNILLQKESGQELQ